MKRVKFNKCILHHKTSSSSGAVDIIVDKAMEEILFREH